MAGAARRIFELTPQGPDTSRAVARPLAQSGGRLVGQVVAGAVRTWLEHDGDRVLLVWPGGFRARIAPLEVLDDDGRVVAKGGEHVTVGGGFLKAGRALTQGESGVFGAWGVTSRRAANR